MTKYVIVQKLLKLLTISVYVYYDVIVYYSLCHDLTQMSVKQSIKKFHVTQHCLCMCTQIATGHVLSTNESRVCPKGNKTYYVAQWKCFQCG